MRFLRKYDRTQCRNEQSYLQNNLLTIEQITTAAENPARVHPKTTSKTGM